MKIFSIILKMILALTGVVVGLYIVEILITTLLKNILG